METATLTKKATLTKWDASEYIDTKEEIIALLDVLFEENDPQFLLRFIGDILRSEGINEVARELGLTRDELCQNLVPTGNPTFETVVKLLDILGFHLKMEAKSA